MTAASTKTAADFAPEAQFLLDHPDLPVPRGIDFVSAGGIYVCLNTPDEVARWAQVIGVEVRTSGHTGNTHHIACTFAPFYISATAIVEPAAVSS